MAMAKDANSPFQMIKLGLILALYATVSCTILAFVNYATKGKIEQNQINKANEAMKAVMADADEFEKIDNFETSEDPAITISSVYLAKSNGTVIGGVAQVSGPTYDKATIIAGLKTNGIVTGIQFLELTDSPGFGLKANDPTFTLANGKTFYGQFEGLDAKKGFAVGSEIDAISGATITSVGVANLVHAGTESLAKYFTEHNYE